MFRKVGYSNVTEYLICAILTVNKLIIILQLHLLHNLHEEACIV